MKKIKKVAKSNDFKKAGETFREFCKTIAALRHPKTGCPWDLKQDHRSLRFYMIEEAYEACYALDKKDPKEFCDELGDVLLQVVLHAQIADDINTFNVKDVIDAINKKMRFRHPHVFGKGKQLQTPEQVKAQWEILKAQEKQLKTQEMFAEIPKHSFPASLIAYKIGKTAARINFDWSCSQEVFKQLQSECQELQHELKKSKFRATKKVREELGDVIFTIAQLCRHLGFDPETIAVDGNQKFLKRFRLVEKLAKKQKVDLRKANQKVLELLWREAKTLEAIS